MLPWSKFSNLQLESLDHVSIPSSSYILNVTHNCIETLGTRVYPGVRVLHINHNRLIDIDRIEHVFPNLEVLDLGYNEIVDISRIKWPDSLTRLALDGNPLLDVRRARFPPSLDCLMINRIPGVCDLSNWRLCRVREEMAYRTIRRYSHRILSRRNRIVNMAIRANPVNGVDFHRFRACASRNPDAPAVGISPIR